MIGNQNGPHFGHRHIGSAPGRCLTKPEVARHRGNVVSLLFRNAGCSSVHCAGKDVAPLSGPGTGESRAESASPGTLVLRVQVSPAVALRNAFHCGQRTGPSGASNPHGPFHRRRNCLWESAAVFKADAGGVVGAASAHIRELLGRGYFGLLWSMKPRSQRMIHGFLREVRSTAGAVIGHRSHPSEPPSARLRRVPRCSGPWCGCPSRAGCTVSYHGRRALIPRVGARLAAYEWLAQAFASSGFAALTLSVLDWDLASSTVVDSAEYFHRSLEWLKKQPAVKADRVSVTGSKGR